LQSAEARSSPEPFEALSGVSRPRRGLRLPSSPSSDAVPGRPTTAQDVGPVVAAAAAASSDGAAPAGNRGALTGSEGRLGLSVDRLLYLLLSPLKCSRPLALMLGQYHAG
jgi:hypothetical protein